MGRLPLRTAPCRSAVRRAARRAARRAGRPAGQDWPRCRRRPRLPAGDGDAPRLVAAAVAAVAAAAAAAAAAVTAGVAVCYAAVAVLPANPHVGRELVKAGRRGVERSRGVEGTAACAAALRDAATCYRPLVAAPPPEGAASRTGVSLSCPSVCPCPPPSPPPHSGRLRGPPPPPFASLLPPFPRPSRRCSFAPVLSCIHSPPSFPPPPPRVHLASPLLADFTSLHARLFFLTCDAGLCGPLLPRQLRPTISLLAPSGPPAPLFPLAPLPPRRRGRR